jgi:hypothetical protein
MDPASVVRTAIMKYQRLGNLNSINLFAHSFAAWKFKIKVPAGLVFSEVSVFCLQMAVFSIPLHVVFPLYAHTPGIAMCIQIFSSYKDVLYGVTTAHKTSFNLNHPIIKALSLNSHILSYLGVRNSTYEFWMLQFSP